MLKHTPASVIALHAVTGQLVSQLAPLPAKSVKLVDTGPIQRRHVAFAQPGHTHLPPGPLCACLVKRESSIPTKRPMQVSTTKTLIAQVAARTPLQPQRVQLRVTTARTGRHRWPKHLLVVLVHRVTLAYWAYRRPVLQGCTAVERESARIARPDIDVRGVPTTSNVHLEPTKASNAGLVA